MDRRNGGDQQAPPRPPKLLPRVHRPRAPEPMEVLGDTFCSRRNDRREETTAGLSTNARSATGRGTGVGTGTGTGTCTETESASRTATPRCTNSDQLPHLSTYGVPKPQLEKSEQKQQQEQLNSIKTATTTVRTVSPATTTTTTTTAAAARAATTAPKTLPRREHPLANFSVRTGSSSSNTSTNSSSSNNNNNTALTNNSSSISSKPENGISGPGTFVIHNNLLSDPNLLTTCPDYENYQIYHLTYLPQRPASQSLNSLSSPTITATNSFTRRRPQPGTPGADAPWRISGNNSSFGSFFSHFQNAENTSASPVTLAQPRPESQRLTNEYVDTPLRTAQILQNASRTQHPAGQQQDNNQAHLLLTTHHVLLLPQRDPHQPRAATATAGNTTTTTVAAANLGTDGTDGFRHSQNPKTQATVTHQANAKVRTPSPPPRNNNAAVNQQTQQQQQQQATQQLPPITKQPALTKCKGTPGEMPIIQITNASPPNSPIGTPIIITGGLGSSNSITCPRCGLCRCEQCKSSGLPQKWLCKKSCLCSAESVIDYTTCLCCAKAIFYHCATQGDMDDEEDYVDDPCSCTPRKRLQRWGWLSALSLVLPCLWCYWPMRGCTWLCEKCYNRFAGRGCRCQQSTTSNMLPIMPLASHGNSADANSNIQGANTSSHLSNATTKSKGGHGHHRHHQLYHHHHHHHGESVASRMLRKGDITPEKRLLDTNIDY